MVHEGLPTLNIGCGNGFQTGGFNMDIRALPGVDIIADILALPIKEKSVERLFCNNVLECVGHKHFLSTIDELCRVTTRHLYIRTLLLDRVSERILERICENEFMIERVESDDMEAMIVALNMSYKEGYIEDIETKPGTKTKDEAIAAT